jgi:hypothetical protein
MRVRVVGQEQTPAISSARALSNYTCINFEVHTLSKTYLYYSSHTTSTDHHNVFQQQRPDLHPPGLRRPGIWRRPKRPRLSDRQHR